MAALVALAFAAIAFQQAEAPAPAVDDLVRVDAFVADARNRPLDTLTAADFELREDGETRTIEAVKFIRPATEPRLVAIYLDEYHLSPSSANLVREQLLRFIDHDLDPADRLVVMKPLDSLFAISLQTDRETARRVIAGFVGRKGHYDPADSYERQYMGNAPAAIDPAREQITVSALHALAVNLGLAAADARKALIVISEGFDGAVERRRRVSLPTVDSITQAANRSNVSVYTIDPRADAADVDDAGALAPVVAATDGVAITGPEGLDAALGKIASDSGAYYLISYRSAGRTDNRFHAVALRVKRPGAKVRTRAGYWAASPDELFRAEMIALAKSPPAPKPFNPPLRTSRMIRPWFGVSRGDGGLMRVTFVWEPMPPTPGERSRVTPDRVQFTAVDAERAPVFEGTVLPVGSSVLADDTSAKRAVFDVPPGRLRIRMSIEDSGEQEVDVDVRDIAVSDLSAAVAIGSPEVLRVRNAREFRALESDPDAIPVPSRVFSRMERLVIRIPAYAADGPPVVSALLMTKIGQPMRALTVTPPAAPGGPNQIDLPLAGFASGEYQIQFKAKGEAGEAKESIAFRVTP